MVEILNFEYFYQNGYFQETYNPGTGGTPKGNFGNNNNDNNNNNGNSQPNNNQTFKKPYRNQGDSSNRKSRGNSKSDSLNKNGISPLKIGKLKDNPRMIAMGLDAVKAYNCLNIFKANDAKYALEGTLKNSDKTLPISRQLCILELLRSFLSFDNNTNNTNNINNINQISNNEKIEALINQIQIFERLTNSKKKKVQEPIYVKLSQSMQIASSHFDKNDNLHNPIQVLISTISLATNFREAVVYLNSIFSTITGGVRVFSCQDIESFKKLLLSLDWEFINYTYNEISSLKNQFSKILLNKISASLELQISNMITNTNIAVADLKISTSNGIITIPIYDEDHQAISLSNSKPEDKKNVNEYVNNGLFNFKNRYGEEFNDENNLRQTNSNHSEMMIFNYVRTNYQKLIDKANLVSNFNQVYSIQLDIFTLRSMCFNCILSSQMSNNLDIDLLKNMNNYLSSRKANLSNFKNSNLTNNLNSNSNLKNKIFINNDNTNLLLNEESNIDSKNNYSSNNILSNTYGCSIVSDKNYNDLLLNKIDYNNSEMSSSKIETHSDELTLKNIDVILPKKELDLLPAYNQPRSYFFSSALGSYSDYGFESKVYSSISEFLNNRKSNNELFNKLTSSLNSLMSDVSQTHSSNLLRGKRKSMK